MATLLRIMCWNIAEGSNTGAVPHNAHISAIAEQIRSRSPDLVLLNEVVHYDLLVGGWIGDNVKQTDEIARLLGLKYYQSGRTVRMGWTGHKVVAVLSRYPLGSSLVHPVVHNNRETGYATLQTSCLIDNRTHHVFSMRFNAHIEDENVSAHQQAIQRVQSLDPNDSVIFGGDFNANRRDDPQFVDFGRRSGLTNAFYEHPDPSPCTVDPETIIDHVFYRGPYKVGQTELKCPWGEQGPELSEHPWLYVELLSPPDAVAVMVPNVLSTPREQAAQVIRAAGLAPHFTGSTELGAWVLAQSPNPGIRVVTGSTVTIELRVGSAEVLVPDVREMRVERATQLIHEAGLKPKLVRSGTWVRKQTPEADTRVRAGSTVTLELSAGHIP